MTWSIGKSGAATRRNRFSEFQTAFTNVEVLPVSYAGQRIVTSHGDFHPGNIIVSNMHGKKVIKVVDFEQSHVSFAIQDISYCFGAKSFKHKETKLAFAEAYLKELGNSFTESDVHALVLDAERCSLSTAFYSRVVAEFMDGETMDYINLEDCYQFKLLADEALRNAELAEEIIDKGIHKCQNFLSLKQSFENAGIGTRVTSRSFCLYKR